MTSTTRPPTTTRPADPAAEAEALVDEGLDLAGAGRLEDALAVFESVVADYGGNPAPAVAAQVAWAMWDIGVVLSDLDRPEAALAAYDDVLARFGGETDPMFSGPIAEASYNRGVVLAGLGRVEEAIEAYGVLIDRFGEHDDAAVELAVADSYQNLTILLADAGRHDEVIENAGRALERFLDHEDSEVMAAVADLLFRRAFALHELDSWDEGITDYETLIDRFGDSSDPETDWTVASAMLNLAFALEASGRVAESIDAYEAAVEFFDSHPDLGIDGMAAQAGLSRGAALIDLDRMEAAVEAFDDVIGRFAGHADAEVLSVVADAMFNKGVVLVAALSRYDEAVTAFDALIDTFGDGADPALAGLIAEAVALRDAALVKAAWPPEVRTAAALVDQYEMEEATGTIEDTQLGIQFALTAGTEHEILVELRTAAGDLDTHLAANPDDVEALILSARLGRVRIILQPVVQVYGDVSRDLLELPPIPRTPLHAALDRALELDPARADAAHLQARLYAMSVDGSAPTDLDSAIRYSELAVSIDADNVEYREGLALLLLAQGRTDEALAVIAEVSDGSHPIEQLMGALAAFPLPEGAELLESDTQYFVDLLGMAYGNLRVRIWVVPVSLAELEDFYREAIPGFELFGCQSHITDGGGVMETGCAQHLMLEGGEFVPAAAAADLPEGDPDDGISLWVMAGSDLTADDLVWEINLSLPADIPDVWSVVFYVNFSP